jgi:hypothetical protein
LNGAGKDPLPTQLLGEATMILYDEIREPLAVYAHQAWSGWMIYMFSRSRMNGDGTMTIPADLVKRWKRQAATGYDDLPEPEKESDRTEADKMIAILGSYDD